MHTLPLFAKIRNRRCLVVGGGTVALSRVEQLLRAGADVTAVAPDFRAELKELEADGQLQLRQEEFHPGLIADNWLIVAATDVPEVNREVARVAEQLHRFCNVVDDPEHCSFIMPAVIDRDPITVAISSAGRSPVLARWIKGLIEETLPARIGDLARLAGSWRDRVKEVLPNLDDRRHFWQVVLRGEVADHAYAGRESASEASLEATLTRWAESKVGDRAVGQAYLVGAGPGDPELITLRGRKLLARADVVLYDRLVNPAILDYARRDADRISVGKQAGRVSIRQEQLNRLLVSLVASGKHVCRLKGGDPMVFGRVREELEALSEAGLPFQIIPGVSAFEGCAAYAGIPLTVRDEARAILIATGHTSDHGSADLSAFRPDQTLALYMSVSNFPSIARRLLELGHARELPLAIVENGTTANQRVIRGSLGTLDTLAATHDVRSPALLLIGKTVPYADRYAWFNPETMSTGAGHDLAEVI